MSIGAISLTSGAGKIAVDFLKGKEERGESFTQAEAVKIRKGINQDIANSSTGASEEQKGLLNILDVIDPADEGVTFGVLAKLDGKKDNFSITDFKTLAAKDGKQNDLSASDVVIVAGEYFDAVEKYTAASLGNLGGVDINDQNIINYFNETEDKTRTEDDIAKVRTELQQKIIDDPFNVDPLAFVYLDGASKLSPNAVDISESLIEGLSGNAVNSYDNVAALDGIFGLSIADLFIASRAADEDAEELQGFEVDNNTFDIADVFQLNIDNAFGNVKIS